MLNNLSLKYRIAIIIFLLEAIMIGVVLQLTLNESLDASSALIVKNEQAILDVISGISKTALITEEYSELQVNIKQFISISDASKLLLTNHNKIIVVSSIPTDIGKVLPLLESQDNHVWLVKEITNTSGLLGVLAIEFSNAPLFKAHTDSRDFGIKVALMCMLVIATIGLAAGYLLTRRLESITQTAEELANGNYEARTAITGKDEIGNLAKAFNSMVHRLVHSNDELSEALFTLTRSEKKLSTTLLSIGDAVITTDTFGIVTGVNPVAEALTGWPANEALGQPLKKIFPIINAETRETIANPIDKVISSGEVVHLSNHTTLISRNGHEYQIADSAAPIKANNKTQGLVLVFNDVSEQYKLRETANKAMRDLQSIMDYSPAVIYVKDIEGRFTFVNKKFVSLFHITTDEIIGKTMHQIFPTEIANKLKQNDLDVLTKGTEIESEEIVPQDDGLHTYHSVKFPIHDKDDNITAVCGISTDITERKLQDEQLRRSQKMDALGKLTSGIAHDFNNLLGVILGYAEVLQGVLIENPKALKFAHEIHHAGNRGADLTKKLLALTRNNSNKNESVNINNLLNRSRLVLEKTLTARIEVKYQLDDELWPIYIDENDLENAMLNISINAMHAMQDSGHLSFRTQNKILNENDAKALQLPAGHYVLLSISDTGHGMTEDVKEKAFDPFFTTKEENGTGLGLSQVYALIEHNNGAINIGSEPNQGTQITLYLPRHLTTADVSIHNEKEVPFDTRGHESILVVDDEHALLTLVEEILLPQGYKVFTADSVQQAYKILDSEEIDLLLSDIIMPVADGYELAAVVEQKYPAVKIQLASGFSDSRHDNKVSIELRENILQKPFHSKVLLKKIRELLNA